MVNRKESLKEKARYLSSDISKKFVPKPSWRRIFSNTIRGLRLFVNNLWWKEYFRTLYMQQRQLELGSTIVSDSSGDENDSTSTTELINEESQ